MIYDWIWNFSFTVMVMVANFQTSVQKILQTSPTTSISFFECYGITVSQILMRWRLDFCCFKFCYLFLSAGTLSSSRLPWSQNWQIGWVGQSSSVCPQVAANLRLLCDLDRSWGAWAWEWQLFALRLVGKSSYPTNGIWEEAKIPRCSQSRKVLYCKFDAYEVPSIMFEGWPLGHCVIHK